MVKIEDINKKVFTREHKNTALDAARKGITLMKNTNKALPLQKTTNSKKIFVTGPNADNMTILGDWASPQPEENLVTIKEGLQELCSAYGYTLEYSPVSQIAKQIKDQEISDAAAKSKQADIHILVLGENAFRHDWPNKTIGENIDRASFVLSGKQVKLAQEIKSQGKPLIVVYVSGSPISDPWIEANADAIINAWEPGVLGGQAIAEAIFGKINPSGKCPLTIPRSVGQLQMVYNHKPTMYRHKYHDIAKTPLYAFGHGLSYTSFTYKNLNTIGSINSLRDSIIVNVDVTNSGQMDGDEVAQLYVRDKISSITRPVLELKGYQRVAIKAGETKTISFILKPDHLAFYNLNFDYVIEKGAFQVMVGGSSESAKNLKTEFTIDQNLTF
jgi:beta-glucosidase